MFENTIYNYTYIYIGKIVFFPRRSDMAEQNHGARTTSFQPISATTPWSTPTIRSASRPSRSSTAALRHRLDAIEVPGMLSRTQEGRADRTRFPARLLRFIDPGTGPDRPLRLAPSEVEGLAQGRLHRHRQGPAKAGLSSIQERLSCKAIATTPKLSGKENYFGNFQAEIGRKYRGLQ
jgi:hypothetical protein